MTDEECMQLALVQAQGALAQGEVPVGAVVVRHGVVIATGRNNPIASHDPTAHAEVQALRAAAQVVGNYRLDDCELFVTLEPCAMCAGAMLHARLQRVVYGAPDPKTGCAGSVLNLFDQPQLNHQTQVQGGVLGQDAADLLQGFFQGKRALRPAHPLREDALRTPEQRFAAVSGFDWPSHWVSDLPTLNGLRLHYLDLGPRDAHQSVLALHGQGTWGYVYRYLISDWLQQGWRVVVPDLIGYGRSDKPKKTTQHSPTWHRQILDELHARLVLQQVCLVLPEGDDLLGLAAPPGTPAWVRQVQGVPVDTLAQSPKWSPAQRVAYQAPFVDRGHEAALRPWA